MARYFLEVTYKGTAYSGFQAQPNANTIQSETEKALAIILRKNISLTGSSRTDAGVHALQNFFHFDTDIAIEENQLYNLNSVLPYDISAKNIYPVNDDAHCRFDAITREYKYQVYQKKDPFLNDYAYYYPFKVNLKLLQQSASIIKKYVDFTSFSKRNTQVKTFNCNIISSAWTEGENYFVFHITANRFLRGMVKGLVATMLKAGREIISIKEFEKIIESCDCTKADFSAPSQGLFLVSVQYPRQILF